MSSKEAHASNRSVAVAGDNNGSIFNVNAAPGSRVSISSSARRRVPSLLGRVIAVFAEQKLADYASKHPLEVPPEVQTKLDFNDFNDQRVIDEYTRYAVALERAYKGAEQTNADARVLVRRKAGEAYDEILDMALRTAECQHADRADFVRKNSRLLVRNVVKKLVADYNPDDSADNAYEEAIQFAVSLVVAEAIFDCAVLEKPGNAATT